MKVYLCCIIIFISFFHYLFQVFIRKLMPLLIIHFNNLPLKSRKWATKAEYFILQYITVTIGSLENKQLLKS